MERRYHQGHLRRIRALSSALLALVLSLPAAAEEEEESLGDPASPAVILAIPRVPTVLNSKGLLMPGMRDWLSLVARKAGVHIRLQPANYDRRAADMSRHPDHCVLAYVRLPERETGARWLAEIRRDRIVFVARQDDPFQGDLNMFMKAADDNVGAPSGIYRDLLSQHGVAYQPVEDQQSLARMVQAGRVRFGMMITATLDAPEVKAMRLRIVAELPPQQFWFACSPQMPDNLAHPLAAALRTEEAESLRRQAMGEAPAAAPIN